MKQFISARMLLASVAVVLVAGARADDVPMARPPAPVRIVTLPSAEAPPVCGWAGWLCKQRCVCEPEMKKIPHVIYDCRCEKFCSSVCSWGLLANLFGDGCCGCRPPCGWVRTRHVLLKKTVTEDCPSFKCVVPHCTECVFPAGPKH